MCVFRGCLCIWCIIIIGALCVPSRDLYSPHKALFQTQRLHLRSENCVCVCVCVCVCEKERERERERERESRCLLSSAILGTIQLAE